MSSETLSQSEIDLLLRKGAAAVKPAPVATAGPDVQVYDFRRPNRVSKEKLRTLEAMYERMVKSLEGWLISRVRGQVELKLVGIEPFSFGEFVFSLPMPCASYLFDIADSGGLQGVIDVGHEFAYFLVDRFFGGGGEVTTMDRALTPIERMAVRGLAERVVTQLNDIWADHVQLDMQLAGFESFPEILQAVNREDPVLVANIEVRAGEMTSLLLVCLPFAVLDKFFAGTTHRRINSIAGSERERVLSRELTEASLRATHVEIAARLPVFQLPLGALGALRVGSVLTTGIPRDAQIELYVSGQHRFTGAPGRVGPSLAVRVTEVHHQDDEPAHDAADAQP
ncbi:MAG TPA: FliM/FliN family flagellar motor switch protein, partial [Gemmatimonadaceae bacterium]|nr:FliM/FliN family flagellar motor switch protein [Gemmatimonadaceae bacterium]